MIDVLKWKKRFEEKKRHVKMDQKLDSNNYMPSFAQKDMMTEAGLLLTW